MQPHQLRKLVRRWAIPVAALMVLGAVIAYLVSRSLTPIYEAKGDVLVVAGPGQTAIDITLNAAEVTTTAATLLTEPPLLQKVIDALRLNETTDSLAREITALPQTNTELVDVLVRDPSATRAAQIANALMGAYVAQVTQANTDRVNQEGAALQTQINQLQAAIAQENQQLGTAPKGQDTTALRAAISGNNALLTSLTLNYSTFKATQSQNLETVSVAAPAAPPLAPASPRVSVNTALGAVGGLLLAIGLVALLEFLDQGLKTADDIRDRVGVPCLGVVPSYRTEKSGELSDTERRQFDAASESYRRLRTNILFSAPDTDLTSVVVTSARSGEGKTRTAANLAVALAGSDKRIVLIDADMRRPSQHRLFARSQENGVSDLILATSQNHIPRLNGTHATEHPNLSLVTSGTTPPNPSELLASKGAALLLHSLAASHDMLVIDTPPADVVTDALTVAAGASATIVVVEAGRTNAGQATAVIESLRGVGANVIGIVLNKAKRRTDGAYYYQHGYSDKSSPKGSPPSTETQPGSLA
jgi:succinoglycan biosynthesis transport protein ExoP